MSRLCDRSARGALCAAAVLVWCLGAAVPGRAGSDSRRELELQVKAGFLYNFLKFTEWPAQARDRFTIGILGDDEFVAVAREGLRGKEVHGLPVRVLRIDALNQPGGEAEVLHLLYVAPAAAKRGDARFAAWGTRPVLTVGEEADLRASGGIINLVRDGANLRFEINEPASYRAGLTLSSKLMALAQLVDVGESPPP